MFTGLPPWVILTQKAVGEIGLFGCPKIDKTTHGF
jgi:hypothetical protein